MAEYARTVTVVIRSPSLGRGMSNYLVERIEEHSRIAVRTSSHVAGVRGDSHLESVTLAGQAHDRTEDVAADALFLLIGGFIGFMLPRFWLGRRKSGRLGAFNKQLPDTITLIANALRVGDHLTERLG